MFTLTPFKGIGAARLPAAKFLRKLCFFVTEKQPTSIAIGRRESVCGQELHPMKASAFSRRTVSSIGLEDYWVALALRSPHEV